MSVTLGFLALLMGGFVFWLVRQTVNVQPWTATVGEAQDVSTFFNRLPAPKIGLLVLICVITSLFALFVSAYVLRMEFSDWRPLIEPGVLWLNTAILAGGSVAIQMCFKAAAAGQRRLIQQWLIVAATFTIAFVIGQAFAWRQLADAGFYAATNPANAFFYLLTALHVVHLVGGLFYQGRTTLQSFREISDERLGLNVELCAIYSHFLLFVWVVLFILLLQT